MPAASWELFALVSAVALQLTYQFLYPLLPALPETPSWPPSALAPAAAPRTESSPAAARGISALAKAEGESAQVGPATGWRVIAAQSSSGWAWDVHALRFITAEGELAPGQDCRVVASGDAGRGWGADNAFSAKSQNPWGGRRPGARDSGGPFFIGLQCSQPHSLIRVQLEQRSKLHFVKTAVLERQSQNGESWVAVHSAQKLSPGQGLQDIWSKDITRSSR
eukprot:TRINITY_DN3337_c0_g2_i1.p1 TRINITY_DN3337_c0_g2~~TRINITY_DN3337_c0_g2_i1.p1  ORF type:complete len:222 (+),score=30.72 TRINITY_DN3337_c0_g2_i1:55-720(+)